MGHPVLLHVTCLVVIFVLLPVLEVEPLWVVGVGPEEVGPVRVLQLLARGQQL